MGLVIRNDSKILHGFACWEGVKPLWILDNLWERENSLLQELSKQVKTMKHFNLLRSCDAFLGLLKAHSQGADLYLRSWHEAGLLE